MILNEWFIIISFGSLEMALLLWCPFGLQEEDFSQNPPIILHKSLAIASGCHCLCCYSDCSAAVTVTVTVNINCHCYSDHLTTQQYFSLNSRYYGEVQLGVDNQDSYTEI